MKNNQNQQGDVLLLRVSKLPVGCKKVSCDKRGIVLAEGEHTGHHHRSESGQGLALMEAPDGARFLVNETESDVVIRHEEHQPVTVSPGIHQIGGVIEKDWFSMMVRKVID